MAKKKTKRPRQNGSGGSVRANRNKSACTKGGPGYGKGGGRGGGTGRKK